MDETFILQGRRLGPGELAQIKQLLLDHPDWSRYRLSRELAELWNWRSSSGQLKDMAARTLLLKLEQRAQIELPSRRWASPNRMRHKQMPPLDPSFSQEPLQTPLSSLLPLELQEVSSARGPGQTLFESLLHHCHYLSFRSSVGENLQYLASERTGRPIACLLFGAAAWQCAERDRHIGWSSDQRAAGLHLVANNTRFLVMPWVSSPQLASHLLSRVARRLSQDWQRKYGHPIHLLETFVERDRFRGACYQAANWKNVGQTKGRSRQDAPDGKHYQVAIKDIYLLPLHRQFAQRLQDPQPTPSPTSSSS